MVQYGAARRPILAGAAFETPEAQKKFIARTQRQRMNSHSMCVAFFAPWLLYCVVYYLVSFDLHYRSPMVLWLVVIGIFGILVVGNFVLCALNSYRARLRGDGDREPTWIILIAILMVLAYAYAIVWGNWNFWKHFQVFSDLNNLNRYSNIDPSTTKGQTIMDAGVVEFTSNASVDLTKAMGFKNLDTYCVAPIASSNTAGPVPLANYDFWAVGLNCCEGTHVGIDGTDAKFQCRNYNNPRAKFGVRFMSDSQRDFFRLAVQQAETAYAIRATHPLFFSWVEDPNVEIDANREAAYKWYFIGVLSHFAFQLICVTKGAVDFFRMGHF